MRTMNNVHVGTVIFSAIVLYLSCFTLWQAEQLALDPKTLAIGRLLDWKATAKAWCWATRLFILFILKSHLMSVIIDMSNNIIEPQRIANQK